MVLGAFDGIGEMGETEFFDTGQERVLLLPSKKVEYELGGIVRAARHYAAEYKPCQKAMVDIFDGFVAPDDVVCIAHIAAFLSGNPVFESA